MNIYNEKELAIEVAKAIGKGMVSKGIYTSLIFIPDNHQNEEGYVDAKRFGYNHNTGAFDYWGYTDIVPPDIPYDECDIIFIPGGIQLLKTDRQPFKVHSLCYCDTKIEE